MFEDILFSFGLTHSSVITPFGNGLINHTWKIQDGNKSYILQKINHDIFKNPLDISSNVRLVCDYFKKTQPGYLFPCPLRTNNGEELYHNQQDHYRLYPFVENSYTINVVNDTSQAYEAAKQFGSFTSLLKDFPIEQLKITLPEFHNLPIRFNQFESSLVIGNPGRIKEAAELIDFLKTQNEIVLVAEKIYSNPVFVKRVTHHDSKINNVLFDSNNRGLCVIDLDTLMPGYFISDFGDMMRTYLSPVSEEEKDLDKIEIRVDFFKAIAEGYLDQMQSIMSPEEIDHFVYSGKYMTYMQALRFLTDYLNNDIYYESKYEGHNFVRAGNQVMLLKRLIEKENDLKDILKSV